MERESEESPSSCKACKLRGLIVIGVLDELEEVAAGSKEEALTMEGMRVAGSDNVRWEGSLGERESDEEMSDDISGLSEKIGLREEARNSRAFSRKMKSFLVRVIRSISSLQMCGNETNESYKTKAVGMSWDLSSS